MNLEISETKNILSILVENPTKIFLIRLKHSMNSTVSYYLSKQIMGIGIKEKISSESDVQEIESLIENNSLAPIYKEFENENIHCQAFQSNIH